MRPADAADRFGTGFALSAPPGSPLLGPTSFGHGGAGGELAFADAELDVGFAYVNDQMGGIPDDRARLLVEAVRDCLARPAALIDARRDPCVRARSC